MTKYLIVCPPPPLGVPCLSLDFIGNPRLWPKRSLSFSAFCKKRLFTDRFEFFPEDLVGKPQYKLQVCRLSFLILLASFFLGKELFPEIIETSFFTGKGKARSREPACGHILDKFIFNTISKILFKCKLFLLSTGRSLSFP